MIVLLAAILAVFGLTATAEAQTSINYTVAIPDPVSHIYEIGLDIANLPGTTLDVSMPAWSPGAYLIRDFARNVQSFRAVSNRDRSLTWQQRDKQTWRIEKQPDENVHIQYQVYSLELTDVVADIANPASLFMYLI